MREFQDEKVVVAIAGEMGAAGWETMVRALCGMFETMQAYAGKGKPVLPAAGEIPPAGQAAGGSRRHQ